MSLRSFVVNAHQSSSVPTHSQSRVGGRIFTRAPSSGSVASFGQRRAARISRKSSGVLKVAAVLDVTEESFESEVLQSQLPVVVDFWATWCGPCKLVAPSMEWADKAFQGQLKVVKVDCTDTNKSLMEKYKVYGLPCLIVFKDGQKLEASHHEGAITKTALADYLQRHVGVTVSAAL